MPEPDGGEVVSFSVTPQRRHAPLGRLARRGPSACRDVTGPAFPRRDRRIFRRTLEQPHLFEAAKRPVERPVHRQQARVRRVGERFGDLVAVEGELVAAEQSGGGEADPLFERHE